MQSPSATQAASRALGVAMSAAISLISTPYCLLVNFSAMHWHAATDGNGELPPTMKRPHVETASKLSASSVCRFAHQSSLNRVSWLFNAVGLCIPIDVAFHQAQYSRTPKSRDGLPVSAMSGSSCAEVMRLTCVAPMSLAPAGKFGGSVAMDGWVVGVGGRFAPVARRHSGCGQRTNN